ncbi:unnamed protein product [Cylindrotheca closterium]|uniref:Uncharacterized protein n=1 Tax=Cylindrotheca closterium TaxID=2856 RepID=A0AAD2CNV5_9STRA|nr:unnamed protein product [Cylindrotheca closterium]
MKDEVFAQGLGLQVHIRTKIVGYWSYIQSIAIQIGDDILEIEGSADTEEGDDDGAHPHYWSNYEYQGHLENVAGFPVTQELSSTASYKRSYTIDFSDKYSTGQNITVETYKEFVRVRFNGDESIFGNTVGLLGDCKTGKTYARDGVTGMEDLVELGDEWQVLPYEPRLFHESSHPQFPDKCLKPEGERNARRLAEESPSVGTISMEHKQQSLARLL